MVRFATFFICVLFMLTAPVTAQDGYPLPDNLQPITVENASHIKPLASVGGLLPKDLKWSNDGKILIVNTSAGAQLYNAAQLQQAPIQITSDAAVYDAYFTDQGTLIVNGRQYDPLTGELINTNPPPKPMLSPSGKIEIKFRQTDTETVIDLKKSTTETISLHTGTKDRLNQIVFSPDEKYALLVLDEVVDEFTTVPSISYWNIKTGERIVDHIQTLWYPSRADFFADGKLLVIESYSGEPYGIPQQLDIYDGHTGKIISSYGFFAGSSPNGKRFAILNANQLDIWSDHLIGSVPTDAYPIEGSSLPPIKFSPDNRTLTNTVGKSITIWDVRGDTIPDAPRVTIPTAETISKLIYSPDGKLLISAEENAVVEVWDAATGTKYPQLALLSGRSIYNPVFSRNGALIRATERDGGDTFVWNVATGKQIASLPPNSVFSEDGLHAAYWDGGLVQVIDIPTNQQTTLTVIENNLGTVRAFIPSYGLALFKGTDSPLAYNLQTGEEISHQSDIDFVSAQFSNNLAYFMTRSDTQDNLENLNIWRTDNLNKPVSQIETASKDGQLLLSPNGKIISELNPDHSECKGTYRLWSTQSDKRSELFSSDSCGPQDHAFSPDSRWLLVGWDGKLDVINVDSAIQNTDSANNQSSGKTAISMYVGESFAQSDVINILFSPDGQTVALVRWFNFGFEGGPDIHYRVSLIKFSDLLTLKDNDDLGQIEIPIEEAQTAFFSPDNHWLLTDQGLWDLTTDKQIANFSASKAAFSPDSSLLATVNSKTHKVELWDVSKLTIDAVSPLTSFESQKTRSIYLNGLAFSADGKLLYLSYEGDIQIWGVPAGSP